MDRRDVDHSRSGTQAVDRALHLLAAVAERPDGTDVGISALAAATGLTVSTAHRLVKALVAAGLVDQDPTTERYHLGAGLVALGRRAEADLGLDRWHGLLERLATATGESASLGVRDGGFVLIADHVPSPQPLRFDAGVGSRVPIHASAMGKILLASSDDPAADVASLGQLAAVTPRTIVDGDRLLVELAEIRRRGWSLNDGERHAGVRAVAIALPAAPGRPLAAIAVQGPEVRMTDERLDSVVSTMVDAVRSVSPSVSTL